MGIKKKPAHELMLDDLKVWIEWVSKAATKEEPTPSQGLYISSLNADATKTLHFLESMKLPEDARTKVVKGLHELEEACKESTALKLLQDLIASLEGETAESDDDA